MDTPVRTWQRMAAVIVPITSAAMRCSTPKWLETLAVIFTLVARPQLVGRRHRVAVR